MTGPAGEWKTGPAGPLDWNDWPETPEQAVPVQERLRTLVIDRDDAPWPPARIAAVDAHYSEQDGKTWAAVAEVDPGTLALTRSVLLAQPTRFPYVPGFLSFREVPAMAAALALLPAPPDLVVVDGQGLAHPRRFGLACHLGVVTGLPTIGVAKSRLVGRYAEPGPERGASSPMLHRKEMVGWPCARARARGRSSCRWGTGSVWPARWIWCCACPPNGACRSRSGWPTRCRGCTHCNRGVREPMTVFPVGGGLP